MPILSSTSSTSGRPTPSSLSMRRSDTSMRPRQVAGPATGKRGSAGSTRSGRQECPGADRLDPRDRPAPRSPRCHQPRTPPPLPGGGQRNGTVPAAHHLRGERGAELLSTQRRGSDAVVEALREGNGGATDAPRGKGARGPADSRRREYPGSGRPHLLDAAAILWTARRIFAKAALRIPDDPEWDEHGLRMEIVR